MIDNDDDWQRTSGLPYFIHGQELELLAQTQAQAQQIHGVRVQQALTLSAESRTLQGEGTGASRKPKKREPAAHSSSHTHWRVGTGTSLNLQGRAQLCGVFQRCSYGTCPGARLHLAVVSYRTCGTAARR
jgi:hypothetical protein